MIVPYDSRGTQNTNPDTVHQSAKRTIDDHHSEGD